MNSLIIRVTQTVLCSFRTARLRLPDAYSEINPLLKNAIRAYLPTQIHDGFLITTHPLRPMLPTLKKSVLGSTNRAGNHVKLPRGGGVGYCYADRLLGSADMIGVAAIIAIMQLLKERFERISNVTPGLLVLFT